MPKEIDPEEIKILYDVELFSIAKIAKIIKMTHVTLLKKMDELGIPRRTSGESRQLTTSLRRDGVRALRGEQEMPASKIAWALHEPVNVIRWDLRALGLSDPHLGQKRKMPPIEDVEVLKEEQSLEDDDIAIMFRVRRQSVYAARHRHKIQKSK